MNKNKVEKFIPIALDIIQEVEIANEKNEVPDVYNGYIASFGASIVQSGLLTTVAFFERDNNNTKQDRRKIVNAIFSIIKKVDKKYENEDSLLRCLIKYKSSIDDIEDDIICAAIALKLALRTFEFIEE
ncbi:MULTISPECIES: type III-B CRISPR module-associated protein Cmr5 [Defluviitalea]|uniref:CRISPR type III-B/RAMP module-associated protein Cmr5 n=2 Tax=Defluviitalea TaxID=1185408 RepID=A0A7C8HE26_9FIRM|nr:type III-B CRISPR module-associated protein Cmr5 [Defluviitalea raffinosedens]KAE9633436.1 type III-B CRISPR module-associated protein Cmr5 [Defluviitalea raffinosedens]MBM7687171.1 CRISPR-associated protein Cmr5 [Defluviitalea raffinosedens]